MEMEKELSYRQQYYQENKERLKVYRQQNQEKYNTYQRKYQQKYKSKYNKKRLASYYLRKGLRYDNTITI